MAVTYTKGFSAEDIAEIEAVIDGMVDARFYAKQMDRDPSRPVYNVDLNTLFETNADIRAKIEQDLRRGVERFPESLDLHAFLSLNLREQGRYEEAVEHMRVQAERHPDDADWQIAYATSYAGYGRRSVYQGKDGHERLLEVHEYARTQFHEIAARIYRMDLTNQQKDTLNQFAAAMDAPPRVEFVDARSPLVRTLDDAGARAVNKLNEWMRGGPGED